MSRQLVHPRRNASIASTLPSRATLQLPAPAVKNSRGLPSESTWQTVTGLTDLPCQKVVYERGADEQPAVDGPNAVATHTVLFQALHTSITEQMRLLIDGEIHNILLADCDPGRSVTILKTRRVRS